MNLEAIKNLPDGEKLYTATHTATGWIQIEPLDLTTDDIKRMVDGKMLVTFRSDADDEEYKPLQETDPQLVEALKDHEYATGYTEALLETLGSCTNELRTLRERNKRMVEALEDANRRLEDIVHFAKDHEEPGYECVLCVIDGIATRKLATLPRPLNEP